MCTLQEVLRNRAGRLIEFPSEAAAKAGGGRDALRRVGRPPPKAAPKAPNPKQLGEGVRAVGFSEVVQQGMMGHSLGLCFPGFCVMDTRILLTTVLGVTRLSMSFGSWLGAVEQFRRFRS